VQALAPTSTSNIGELQRFYEEQLLKRIAKERARSMAYQPKAVPVVPVESSSSEESSDSEAEEASSESEESVHEEPVRPKRKRRSKKYYSPRYLSRAFNGANYAYGEPRVYKPRGHYPSKRRRSDDKYEPRVQQQPLQEPVKQPEQSKEQSKAEPVQTHENVERTRARSPIPATKPPVSDFDLFRQHFLGNAQM
jgi:hypothetical protein